MAVDKDNQIRKISYNDIIIGVGISFILILISWIIDILVNNLPVSFKTIAQIHQSNPIHWIINVSPIVIAGIIYIYLQHRERDKEVFKKIIEQRDQNISKNATLAKKLAKVITTKVLMFRVRTTS